MKPVRPDERPYPRESDARRDVVEIGRRLYAKDLIAAGDGNISVRVGRDRVLVTRSGAHKGFLEPADIVAVDLGGRALDTRGAKPSSEFLMHALCYAERPDCGAVVHAHPPVAVALALAGISMTDCVLSEACLTLGAVPTAPYTTPTTEEVPAVLRDYVRRANAVIMDRHGALCLGRTLDEAWRRMETLEHTARTTQAALTVGKVSPLPEPDLRKLDAVKRMFGIEDPPAPARPPAPAQPRTATSPAPDAETDRIVEAVVARLRR